MPEDFQFNVFLSHSSKDKAVVRPLAERLGADGVKVWLWPVPPQRLRKGGFAEWVLKPGDSIPAKIDPPTLGSYGGTGEGLERSPVLACPAVASLQRRKSGTCERGNLPFRDPLTKERRCLPLRLATLRDTLLPKLLSGALATCALNGTL